MLLTDFLNDVYSVEKELASNTVYLIFLKIRQFELWLDRPATLVDLNSDNINRFVKARLEVRSRETVRGERSMLRALWSYAHEECGLLDQPPSRIRKVSRDVPPPDCWDEAQLKSLLAVCAIQRGYFEKWQLSRADYWTAFVLTAYDTGLRLGDLMLLECSRVRCAGTIRVIQHKTGKPLDVAISDRAWDAIRKIRSQKRKHLFQVICRRHWFPSFARIVEAAGLTGGTKMLRRAAGSLYERDNPGEGHKITGNGRDVFERHYLAQRIVRKGGRLPPRLDA
jgi:integrase